MRKRIPPPGKRRNKFAQNLRTPLYKLRIKKDKKHTYNRAFIKKDNFENVE